MNKKDKIMWGAMVTFSMIAMLVSTYAIYDVYSFQKTCYGCIESKQCAPIVNIGYGEYDLNASLQNKTQGYENIGFGS